MQTWLGLVGVMVLGVVALTQQTPDPSGCYRVRLGAWPDSSKRRQLPSSIFRLDTDVVDTTLGIISRRVEPRISSPARPGPWPLWYGPISDSIHIVWSSGLNGVTLSVVQQGDTLQGIARWFTDYVVFGHPEPEAPAVAVRVACGDLLKPWGPS